MKFPLPTHRGKVTSLTVLSKRVVVDQLFMAPVGVRPCAPPPSLAIVLTLELQLSIFLGSMGIMERRDLKQIRVRFEDIYQPALLANWKIWPAAQVRRFARFPPLWAMLNHDTVVYQFSFYTSPISCPIPTNMWRFLDPLPVSSQFCVCLFGGIFLAADTDMRKCRESEKQDAEYSPPFTSDDKLKCVDER